MTQIATPKPVFDNVKDWPSPAPASAGMGHNAPPLDEMIVMQLNDALDEKAGFRSRIADIIAKGADPADCEDDDRAGRFGDFLKMAKAAQDFIDGERVRIKQPYLEATRALDGTAKTLVDQIGDARQRVKAKLDKYVSEQAAKVRAEQARIAAAQAEMRRQAEEQAAAERAAAAQDGAGSPAAPPPESSPPPTPVATIALETPVFRGDLGSRVGVKVEWRHKIESVRKLPDALLNHPKVIEALDGVIKGQIRGGVREIKGVTVWSEDVSSVR